MAVSLNYKSALRTKFNTDWAGATEIEWVGVPFNIPANKKWVRFFIDSISSRQASTGAPGQNIFEYENTLTLSIFTDNKVGTGEHDSLAQAAANIFFNYTDTANNIFFEQPPTFRPAGVFDNYLQTNIIMPFVVRQYT